MKSWLSKRSSLALSIALIGCLFLAGCSNAFTASDRASAGSSADVNPDANRVVISGYTTNPSNADQGVLLHAYMWTFNDIKAALPTIAASGYTGVQVSPVQKTKEAGSTWWLMYQPCNFDIGNTQLGTYDEFVSLCSAADTYGIKIIVDAVLNHVADNGTSGQWATAVDASLKNTAYFHNLGSCTNYANRYNMTQQNLGNLPDLNTQNPTVQGFIISFLNKCVAAGADGFRFDAAKHIETTEGEDSGQSWQGSFWTNVLSALNGKNLYLYGEVLPDTADNHEVYTNYFDITAHGYIWTVLNGVNSKNLSGIANYNHQNSNLDPTKCLCYIENHDSYQDGTTASQTYWTRKMANAILVARSGITTLILDRPNEDLWKDADLVAMNVFHNKMAGTSEYLRWAGNETLVVERGNIGVAIINTGSSSKSISVATTLANGTYTNRATQAATLTVSNGTLSGTIPAGNVVVLYGATAITVPAAPATLTAGTPTNSSVPLTWGVSSGAASYGVYQATSSTGTYSLAATCTSASCTITGLDSGTTYYFKVSATNSAGTSGYSPIANVTTKTSSAYTSNYSDMYLRGSMNSWGATAMTLTANNTWTVSVNLTAAAATTYKYEIGGATTWSTNWGTGSSSGTAALNGGNLSYTPGVTGSYTFKFNDSTLAYSVTSNTTVTIPAAPTGLAAGTATTTTIPLSWTASTGATSYIVYRSAASTGTYSQIGTSAATSYTDSGLAAGATWYYKVAAVNSAGTSALSAYTTGKTSSSTTTTTTIKVVYDVGYGNMLYLRGSVAPLSWTLGTAGTWTTGNVWTYTTTSIAAGTAFEFKALINDSKWSDGANFTGTGGSTVTVTPTFNGNFYDTMDNMTNWTTSGYTGAGKWAIYSARARAYGCSTESVLTYKYNMSKTGTTVTFSFKYETTGLDSGEYLAADVYNGSTWTQVATYTGTKTATNVSIDVTNYQSTNFKVRFRAKMSDSTEYAYVDNVTVSITK